MAITEQVPFVAHYRFRLNSNWNFYIKVKVRDPSTNTAVIRINSKERSFVSTALPFILKIGKCRCTLQLLFEGFKT